MYLQTFSDIPRLQDNGVSDRNIKITRDIILTFLDFYIPPEEYQNSYTPNITNDFDGRYIALEHMQRMAKTKHEEFCKGKIKSNMVIKLSQVLLISNKQIHVE